MKQRLLFLLLFISFVGFAQTGGVIGATASQKFVTSANNGLQTQLDFYNFGATDKALVYVPAEPQPAGGWPVIFWYHGNGERGTRSVTFDNIGTGNGVTTVFSGSLTNTNARVLHTSVIVKVNGANVATGRDGIITGTGVTGTYDRNDNTSAAYSVTFTTPPPNTHVVRIDYTESDLLTASYPMILNSGDSPSGVMVVCPQISRGTGGFDATTEWDDVITVLDANFTVNHDRFFVTGLSLGGDMCHTILTSRNLEFAAYIAAANGSAANIPGAANALWTTTEKRGKLYVQGSADGTGVITAPTTMANANANNVTAIFGVESTLYWNIGHSASLWDNKVFNRKNRTDQAGLAPFDFVDWFKRFSLDDEEQATLLTAYAENTLDIVDYRLASKMVATLSSGAPKTALLGRLTNVKIQTKPWYFIDHGNSTRLTSSDVTFNNITSAAVNTTLTGLKNDNGGSAPFVYSIVAVTAATPAVVDDVGSGRFQSQALGLEFMTNRDGMTCDNTGTGNLRFSNLDNGKLYTVRIFCAASNNAFTNEGTLSATIGTTKTQYCDLTNTSFMEWSDIAPSSGQINITSIGATTVRNVYIQGVGLKEQ